MGVPPFLITATVEAILAQRLVRRVCSNCREPVTVNDEILSQLELTRELLGDRTFYRGRGCEKCNNTGYKGRVGLFELMVMNDDLREMVLLNASTDELREKGREYGMTTLRECGMNYAYQGVTTADEVIRETILDA
jgi:type IV pilus assembly protein PilB